MERLRQAGITPEDPRIRDIWTSLEESDGDDQRLDLARFTKLCQRNRRLLARAITGELVIPDFPSFVADITEIPPATSTGRLRRRPCDWTQLARALQAATL